MSARKKKAPPKKGARTKAKSLPVTLPSKHVPGWLDSLDRRASYPRLLLSRRDALVSDLGGADALSYQQRTLAERAIYLEAVTQQMEAKHAQGEQLNTFQYIAAINALGNIFKTLGMQRAARKTANLAEYIEAKRDETQE